MPKGGRCPWCLGRPNAWIPGRHLHTSFTGLLSSPLGHSTQAAVYWVILPQRLPLSLLGGDPISAHFPYAVAFQVFLYILLSQTGSSAPSLCRSSSCLKDTWLELSLGIHGRLVPGHPPHPLWIPKSSDAQVSYIKWSNTCTWPMLFACRLRPGVPTRHFIHADSA